MQCLDLDQLGLRDGMEIVNGLSQLCDRIWSQLNRGPACGDILMMKPPPSVALGRDEAQASSSQDASYQIGDLFGQPRNGKSPPSLPFLGLGHPTLLA